MRRYFYVAVILISLFSCRTFRHLSDFQMCSDTVSVSRFMVTDSVSDLFQKSEFASKEWDIIWERTLYNSDTGFYAPLREKQTLVLTSRSVSKKETTADNTAVGRIECIRNDSSHVEVNRHDETEKEGVSPSRNIFWILIVLLVAGVCVRILKY